MGGKKSHGVFISYAGVEQPRFIFFFISPLFLSMVAKNGSLIVGVWVRVSSLFSVLAFVFMSVRKGTEVS